MEEKETGDLSVLESKYDDIYSNLDIGELCVNVITGHHKKHHEKNLTHAYLTEFIPEGLQNDFKSVSDKAKPLFYEKYCQGIDLEAYLAAIKQLVDSIEPTIEEYEGLLKEMKNI